MKMKLQIKLPEGFSLFPHAVSCVLMLADLLLLVPAQRMVTERDINAQLCGNHMPAYD